MKALIQAQFLKLRSALSLPEKEHLLVTSRVTPTQVVTSCRSAKCEISELRWRKNNQLRKMPNALRKFNKSWSRQSGEALDAY
jgi:hypothetical protein